MYRLSVSKLALLCTKLGIVLAGRRHRVPEDISSSPPTVCLDGVRNHVTLPTLMHTLAFSFRLMTRAFLSVRYLKPTRRRASSSRMVLSCATHSQTGHADGRKERRVIVIGGGFAGLAVRHCHFSDQRGWCLLHRGIWRFEARCSAGRKNLARTEQCESNAAGSIECSRRSCTERLGMAQKPRIPKKAPVSTALV